MTGGVWSLWRRELVRFFAAGSPLLFWLLLGSGFSSSFRVPGSEETDYLEYFYPGTLVLVVLFAAIFSTISIIEDRREGFLQGVLAAPVSRTAIVAGKVLGGATLAWLQGAAFLLLAPVAGLHVSVASLLAAAGVLALLALVLTAIGFACAWSVDSVQGFHAIMNLLLVPLWLLSGAVFPLTGAPAWLAVLMRLNPLTYGVAALRQAFYGAATPAADGLPGAGASLLILVAVGAVAFAADLLAMRRGRLE
jgi:ABC-2 type transport system permease protein